MTHSLRAATIGALVLSSVASAQTESAPSAWPVGCQVPYTFANDGDNTVGVTPCVPGIFDDQGQSLAPLPCPQILAILEPGDAYTTYWFPVDGQGDPLPAGTYHFGPGGPPIELGGTTAGLAALGDPTRGEARGFELCAPAQADETYVLLASGSSDFGIPFCAGSIVLPLDPDLIFLTSLQFPPNFQNFVGVLDAEGRASAAFDVPANPNLAGLDLSFAYLVLDFTTPCGFADVSPAVETTIL